MQFRTRAIHVGQDRDAATGAIVPPIHVASTFVQPDASMTAEYDYARTASPTRRNFETTLAGLDNGTRALAFASGMAATHCVTQLLAPGDRGRNGRHQGSTPGTVVVCTRPSAL